MALIPRVYVTRTFSICARPDLTCLWFNHETSKELESRYTPKVPRLPLPPSLCADRTTEGGMDGEAATAACAVCIGTVAGVVMVAFEKKLQELAAKTSEANCC